MKMNGLDYEEIENLTGLSAVNVRVIVSRVRKKFREYYNK
jgi:RNA polymerase sigma-70 factor (ECF subfamily)